MAPARTFLLEQSLSLKATPLGEHDRLLTVISTERGVERLAVPGARRPSSSLAGALPLRQLRLLVGLGRSLNRVQQLQVARSYGRLSHNLGTLAAAQWLAELVLLTVPQSNPVPGAVELLSLHWLRLEQIPQPTDMDRETLAVAVQGAVHLLACCGFGLPLGWCCRSGQPLVPPLGEKPWRASFSPADGFGIGRVTGAALLLNASELALLQRLLRPEVPRRANGDVMGPLPVWGRLLKVLRLWILQHLEQLPRSLVLLERLAAAPAADTTFCQQPLPIALSQPAPTALQP